MIVSPSGPGTVQSIASDALPPLPLTPELGAVALTLCDHDTPLWLDPGLATSEAVVAWLNFHCGAPLTTDAAEAQFALVSKCGTKLPDLDGRPFSAELVSATVDRSLRRLKVDQLDVMLLHSCDLETLKKGDALGALVKARDAKVPIVVVDTRLDPRAAADAGVHAATFVGSRSSARRCSASPAAV